MSGIVRPRQVATNILVLFALWAAASLVARWQTDQPSAHPEATLLYEARFSSADLERIPPVLNAGGTWSATRDASFWVEPADLAAARARLAEQNLPRDMTIGFASPTNSASGGTAMEQEAIRQQRAEGAVTKALRRFRGVRDAQVKLATPRRVCWPVPGGHRNAGRVLLNLEPGFIPTANQVHGMTRLVVELDCKVRDEDVTILDTTGRDLTTLGATGKLD